MKISLVTATVTRDAMTRVPATVPAHEIPVMQSIFGEDNVQIDVEDAGSVELDPAEEGDRLAQKYGSDAVIGVFGKNFNSAVAKACSSHEAKPKGKVAA